MLPVPDMKRTILANINVKLYLMATYVSQGSAATDLRGGENICNYKVTLKPGIRVIQGYRNRHGSIRHL